MLVDKLNGPGLIRPERANGISGTFRATGIIWSAISCRRRASGDEASRRPTSSSHTPHPGPSWVEISPASPRRNRLSVLFRNTKRSRGDVAESFNSVSGALRFLDRDKGENAIRICVKGKCLVESSVKIFLSEAIRNARSMLGIKETRQNITFQRK